MTTPTIEIEPKDILFDKATLRLLTAYKGKYILWPDARYGPEGYRWALLSWQDDGMGIKTHGASFSLKGAAQGIYDNEQLRQEIAREVVVD
jgi:hypothetical protein